MSWFHGQLAQPWRVLIAAVAGLLFAIALAGLLAIAVTRSVTDVASGALDYDVELEDRGDDLRVAVLDMRHYHRNIVFAGPSRHGVADLEQAYAELRDQIRLLGALGVRDPDAPQPEELASLARTYYARVRPAIDRYETDRAAFTQASDDGLRILEELELRAERIDKLGEERAAAALERVDVETGRATALVAIAVLGLGVISAALSYSAIRVLRELRTLYAAQQQTAERLRGALQAKSDFIADASHELRTPLTVLRGNAEVALAQGDDCAHADALRDIVSEAGRMSQIVEDLLLLARSDAGSLSLALERVELEPLLTEIASRASVLARERGATLKADVRLEGTARVDPARLAQAVLILVDNAADHGRPGGRVELRVVQRGGECHIEVADDGPGIPPDQLPRIFERFYRADRARARRGGAGLGLAIAKTIIEGHRGQIEVDSAADRGTCMTVRVPLG
ncbi:MAG: sensor histidine kinase [Candidatus Limnocylindria bacterium]